MLAHFALDEIIDNQQDDCNYFNYFIGCQSIQFFIKFIYVIEDELQNEEGDGKDEKHILKLERNYYHDWHYHLLSITEVHYLLCLKVFDSVVVTVTHHKYQDMKVDHAEGYHTHVSWCHKNKVDQQDETSFLNHEEEKA